MKLVTSFLFLGVNMGHYFTNDNLKSEIKKFEIEINHTKFVFNTDNGVFSKGELDYGSDLLIKNTLPIVKGKVLDLGCGYGPIGCILNKITNSEVLMIDVNKRAVHLANMNIKENKLLNIKAIVNNGLDKITEKFNYIVTNPPIRVGKEILYNLIYSCKERLVENGEIYLVIRKQQGANSFMEDMKKAFDVKIVDKSKGFFIICLK